MGTWSKNKQEQVVLHLINFWFTTYRLSACTKYVWVIQLISMSRCCHVHRTLVIYQAQSRGLCILHMPEHTDSFHLRLIHTSMLLTYSVINPKPSCHMSKWKKDNIVPSMKWEDNWSFSVNSTKHLNGSPVSYAIVAAHFNTFPLLPLLSYLSVPVIRLAGYVEALASRLGMQIPDLSPKQADMWQTRVSSHSVGIVVKPANSAAQSPQWNVVIVHLCKPQMPSPIAYHINMYTVRIMYHHVYELTCWSEGGGMALAWQIGEMAAKRAIAEVDILKEQLTAKMKPQSLSAPEPCRWKVSWSFEVEEGASQQNIIAAFSWISLYQVNLESQGFLRLE